MVVAVAVTSAAWLLAPAMWASPAAQPQANRAATAATGSAIVLASGALQRCIGIPPGVSPVPRLNPQDQAACHRLPGADLFDQAGERFKVGDHAGAAHIVARAADAGNALAQLRLAMMYEQADGVARDLRAAIAWYARAAAQGEPASQAELGLFYEPDTNGTTVLPENWDLAVQLWRASAQQGWMRGQFYLGRAYEFGMAVPQNRGEAIAWFEKAGAQGHAQAAYFARWLRDPTNNIGFRNTAEQNLVLGGKLRFALGAGDPTGIAFRGSADRYAWLQKLRREVDLSEAQTMWRMRKNNYDTCIRNHGETCIPPGSQPR
jgi:uncharacterized protein